MTVRAAERESHFGENHPKRAQPWRSWLPGCCQRQRRATHL